LAGIINLGPSSGLLKISLFNLLYTAPTPKLGIEDVKTNTLPPKI
jgi:hypothetical protein